MIEVSVKETEPMNVAYLAMHGPYSQIPQAMGVLYRFTGERGLAPSGPPHAVYFTPPEREAPEGPEWEVWAPVANPVADEGPDDKGLGTRHVPAMLVASTMYKGPYEDIEPAYRELGQWIPDNGYEMVGPPGEIYYSDPNEVKPADYLTELQFPIAKK